MQPAGVDCSERRAKAGEGKHVGGEGWRGGTRGKLRGFLPLQSVCYCVPGVATPASRYKPRMQAGMENGSIKQWRVPLQRNRWRSCSPRKKSVYCASFTGLAVSTIGLGYVGVCMHVTMRS